MAFKRFEDILAWQQARTLVSEIYNLTNSVDSLRRDLRLTDRLQDASVGIMSHIARGFSSGKPVQFKDDLKTALACIAEIQSLLYICADLERIDRRRFDRLTQMTRICSQMVNELLTLLTKKVEERNAALNHKLETMSGKQEPLSETSDLIEGLEPEHRMNAYKPLSPKETPTRRSRAYPKSKVKASKKETGEYERPDMTDPYDNDDIIDPPEWKPRYTT
jgi:four helix bundle protein